MAINFGDILYLNLVFESGRLNRIRVRAFQTTRTDQNIRIRSLRHINNQFYQKIEIANCIKKYIVSIHFCLQIKKFLGDRGAEVSLESLYPSMSRKQKRYGQVFFPVNVLIRILTFLLAQCSDVPYEIELFSINKTSYTDFFFFFFFFFLQLLAFFHVIFTCEQIKTQM